jgi:thiosulfate reductase cytochrome b subunit
MHWFNVPVLSVMIWSGLLIYWANDVYRIGFGELTLFHFFPSGFYEGFELFGTHWFKLSYSLAKGMAWHFTFMWLFVGNGIAYVGYTIWSGYWRYLVPTRRSFREAWQVVLHDLHLSKQAPPRRLFNGAQQIAYTSVILMGAGSALTGLAIYKPVQVAWLTTLLGGYEWARWEHFWLTVGYVAFFVIHISQVIRAGMGNFLGMVTGHELVSAEEPTYVSQR